MTTSLVSRIATWVLIAVNALALLNHAMGSFGYAENDDARLMFTVFGLLNLVGLMILWLPFRRGEQWAWTASWVPVGAFAVVLPIMGTGGVGLSYAAVAAVMVLALLATRRDFA